MIIYLILINNNKMFKYNIKYNINLIQLIKKLKLFSNLSVNKHCINKLIIILYKIDKIISFLKLIINYVYLYKKYFYKLYYSNFSIWKYCFAFIFIFILLIFLSLE